MLLQARHFTSMAFVMQTLVRRATVRDAPLQVVHFPNARAVSFPNQAIPDVIPANSTLVVEIELLNIYRPMKPAVFEAPHVHGPECGHSH